MQHSPATLNLFKRDSFSLFFFFFFFFEENSEWYTWPQTFCCVSASVTANVPTGSIRSVGLLEVLASIRNPFSVCPAGEYREPVNKIKMSIKSANSCIVYC